jgi:LmbE family N-acetylglucosaminyl deacetylase
MSQEHPRLLVLGAHPDDAEYHAGGLASIYRQSGCVVKLVSVTDGSSGHHFRQPAELIEAWVQQWLERHIAPRTERFRGVLTDKLGEAKAAALKYIEVFEISEYAAQPSAERLAQLFPRAQLLR